LLFISSVYPGAADDEANKKIAAERKAQKYRVRVYEKFPVRNWDKWVDDMQTHLFVQDAQPGAKAKDLLAGAKLLMSAALLVASPTPARSWIQSGHPTATRSSLLQLRTTTPQRTLIHTARSSLLAQTAASQSG
jgi:hypothetical protein